MKAPEEIEKLAIIELRNNFKPTKGSSVQPPQSRSLAETKFIVGFTRGYNKCQQDNTEKSIEFAVWLCENYGRLDYDGNSIENNKWSSGDGTLYSTKELYKEFTQSLNK